MLQETPAKIPAPEETLEEAPDSRLFYDERRYGTHRATPPMRWAERYGRRCKAVRKG